MKKLTGSKTSGLLAIGATYVLVLVDIYLTGGDFRLMTDPFFLMAVLFPAVGAAYGVFFFHWMFESGHVATYPDYGIVVWFISSIVALFYSVIFFGLIYAITDSAVHAAIDAWMAEPQPGFAATVTSQVLAPFGYGFDALIELFKQMAGVNIALWIPLAMMCCWYGRKAGMRHYSPVQIVSG